MIKIANQENRKELYNLWKTAFASKDAGFINYFFEEKYDDFLFYNVFEDEHIVSSIACKNSDIKIGNKLIKASYLTGSFTLYKYQRMNYHQQLMNRIIEDYQYQDLIMMTKSSDREYLKEYGFKPISERQKYLIREENVVPINAERISDVFNVEECYAVNRLFYDHFDCHTHITLNEFEDVLRQFRVTGRKVLVAKNDHNQISGYIVYKRDGSRCVVDEVVYFTGRTLMTLISKLFEQVFEVEVWLSSFENIGKMFNFPSVIEREYTLARINDLNMLNRLFNKGYSSTFEAFNDMINRSNLVIRY